MKKIIKKKKLSRKKKINLQNSVEKQVDLGPNEDLKDKQTINPPSPIPQSTKEEQISREEKKVDSPKSLQTENISNPNTSTTTPDLSPNEKKTTNTDSVQNPTTIAPQEPIPVILQLKKTNSNEESVSEGEFDINQQKKIVLPKKNFEIEEEERESDENEEFSESDSSEEIDEEERVFKEIHFITEATAIPDDWRKFKTEKGKRYYYNIKTRETIWVHPIFYLHKTKNSLLPVTSNLKNEKEDALLTKTEKPNETNKINDNTDLKRVSKKSSSTTTKFTTQFNQ